MHGEQKVVSRKTGMTSGSEKQETTDRASVAVLSANHFVYVASNFYIDLSYYGII
jgi:hypothetical protein